jgi:hypothetical protein
MEPGVPIDQAEKPAAEFFARAGARLTLDVPPGLTDPSIIPRRGDHDLDPLMEAIGAIRPIRPAAVLVPIVERNEPMVLLTRRTAHLKDHAGQISFPGGKIDAGDASPAAAAIREAEEELARVAPGFRLRLNRAEVDDAFEVPLAFLMAPENHKLHSRDWNGMTRTFYAMPFGARYIWGATAGMLRNLYERIYQG